MSLTLDLSGVVNQAVADAMKEFDIKSIVEQSSKTITVKLGEDGKPIPMGLQHKQFEKILKIISIGENLMIKGEAGNGKSHVVAQVAKALDLPFHSMSVSNQTTKTDLLGFVDANGVYRYNGFISAFRDGGIFNMDEIDAGNANVLVVLNSALSNGFVETPAGEMIYKNENFRFVSTANTTGRGATQKYVGRNKLDSATLDRFAVIEFSLDEEIELMLCGGDKKFHNGIKAMRKYCAINYDEIQISQRSSTRLKKLIDADFTIGEALEIAVFKGIDEDIVNSLTKEFMKHYTAIDDGKAKIIEPEKAPKTEAITEDDEDFGW